MRIRLNLIPQLAKYVCIACMVALGWEAVYAAFLQGARVQGPGGAAGATQVNRGRYLVEEIAKCTECHTPRNQTGDLDRQRWLQGAPTWIRPVYPYPNWADRAPALAGLPGISDEQIRRVLEQGAGLNTQPIRPPMHIYHMAPGDATAVIAYLRSVPSRHP